MSTFIGSRKDFTIKYGPFINSITEGTGILPGTLIAQAILESSGKYNGVWSVGGSGLSRKANNFFGIKCGPNWKGATYNINTGEYSAGGTYYVQQNACFRKYASVEDSMKDYINFLKVNKRYATAGVFTAKTVKEQAQALKNAGYATAPNYAKTVYDVYLSISGYLTEEKKKRITIKKILPVAIASAAAYILISKYLKK
jgi:flagellar protein FlgJ